MLVSVCVCVCVCVCVVLIFVCFFVCLVLGFFGSCKRHSRPTKGMYMPLRQTPKGEFLCCRLCTLGN